MIFGNIKLSEWQYRIDGYARYLPDANTAIVLYFYDFGIYEKQSISNIRFYNVIHFLDKIYNPTNKELNMSVEEAKQSVDQFLIKMSKLKAFL